LKADPPWGVDLHDAQIVGKDIWVTVVRTGSKNLSAYGGPKHGTVIDCGVQEYQLSDGHLLRTWDALNTFPLGFKGVAEAPAVGCLPHQLGAAAAPRRGGGVVEGTPGRRS
jgi:hypothetical protein